MFDTYTPKAFWLCNRHSQHVSTKKGHQRPNTEVFKVMHSFNKLAIEVKGWTILRKCTAASDEHKLSFGRVKIQMIAVHPQIDKIYVLLEGQKVTRGRNWFVKHDVISKHPDPSIMR